MCSTVRTQNQKSDPCVFGALKATVIQFRCLPIELIEIISSSQQLSTLASALEPSENIPPRLKWAPATRGSGRHIFWWGFSWDRVFYIFSRRVILYFRCPTKIEMSILTFSGKIPLWSLCSGRSDGDRVRSLAVVGWIICLVLGRAHF